MTRKKFLSSALAALLISGAVLSGAGSVAYAEKGDQGVDWSIYQGANGIFGYANDKFGISQIGGYSGYGTYEQTTYKTQVASLIAAGKRAHTYIWWQNIDNTNLAKQVLDHFLPEVQTPKGSIVALDYEAGSGNMATLLWALDYIRDAGYTPMLYGYKSFLMSHIDLSQIASRYQLWLAEYPDYSITTKPNYGYFPSFDNVGIFQFTSTYRAGGLDGNVDLTGITDSGYNGSTTTDSGKTYVKPSTDTPATNAGQQANNTTLSHIKAWDSVKVNFGTTKWANGATLPSWVQGKTYTVRQVSGNNLLLSGINSWISRSNVEILNTSKNISDNDYAPSSTIAMQDYAQTGTFKPSYSLNVRSSIAGSITGTIGYGDTIVYNHIYVRPQYVWARYESYNGTRYVAIGKNGGESYGVRSSSYSMPASHTYYTVQSGDSWWSIANRYGISMYSLALKNGKTVYAMLHPGDVLLIR